MSSVTDAMVEAAGKFLSAADYYIAGLQAVQRKDRVRDLDERHVGYDRARTALQDAYFNRDKAALEASRTDDSGVVEALGGLLAAVKRTPQHLRMPAEVEAAEKAEAVLHGRR